VRSALKLVPISVGIVIKFLLISLNFAVKFAQIFDDFLVRFMPTNFNITCPFLLMSSVH
jgi:hypothetical protein